MALEETELLAPSDAPAERVVIREGKLTRRPHSATAVGAPSKPRRLEPGYVVAERYRLERRLGEGGTGVVWEATHTVMRRRVALKILKSKDAQAARRFFREARVTAALRHPHIVEVHDIFIVPETGTPAMVMEVLEGAPFSSWTRHLDAKRNLVLPVHQVARILLPVVVALGAAHTAGVIHRDLKPENVFLVGSEPSLDDPDVKVLDFGLAKLTAVDGEIMSTGQLTRSGFLLGTPHYMAPEQVSGEQPIGPATDVWALGVILYESLAGVRPIVGKNLNRLFRAIADPDVPRLRSVAPQTPKPLALLVTRMLARDARERPSLEEIYAVLAPFS